MNRGRKKQDDDFPNDTARGKIDNNDEGEREREISWRLFAIANDAIIIARASTVRVTSTTILKYSYVCVQRCNCIIIMIILIIFQGAKKITLGFNQLCIFNKLSS